MQFATQQEETETQTRHEADMYCMYRLPVTSYQFITMDESILNV